MTDYASQPAYFSEGRIAALEIQGKRARQERRSRCPSVYSFSAIERKAYQRGWDAEGAFIEQVMFPPRN